jgi:hypothetical protein
LWVVCSGASLLAPALGGGCGGDMGFSPSL